MTKDLPTVESASELAERIKQLARGTVEWRVADPETGAYCIAFTRREELDPEGAARDWLKRHIAEFPRSPHANKVVVSVRCFSELERAALEVAALLASSPSQSHDGGVSGQDASQKLTIENAPLGTKAPSIYGGHWFKNSRGWKWTDGSTFPRPGGDWSGKLIAPEWNTDDPGSMCEVCGKWVVGMTQHRKDKHAAISQPPESKGGL